MKTPTLHTVAHRAIKAWLAGPANTLIPDVIVQSGIHLLEAFSASAVTHPEHVHVLAAHKAWADHPNIASIALTNCVGFAAAHPGACTGPHIASLAAAGGVVLPYLAPDRWMGLLHNPQHQQDLRHLLTHNVVKGDALALCITTMMPKNIDMLRCVNWSSTQGASPGMWRSWTNQCWLLLGGGGGADLAAILAANHSPIIPALLKRNVVSWDTHNADDRARLDILVPHLTPAQVKSLSKRLQPASTLSMRADGGGQEIHETVDYGSNFSDIVRNENGCPMDMPNLIMRQTHNALDRATRTKKDKPSVRTHRM